MMAVGDASILQETVSFCRTLRGAGIAVTPSEAIDATATLQLLDLEDRLEVFVGLRSALTSRVEDYPLFEKLFDEFWSRLKSGPAEANETQLPRIPSKHPLRFAPSLNENKDLAYFVKHWSAASFTAEESLNIPLASNVRSTAQKDFGGFEEDVDEISRLARRVAKKLARARSRRWEPVRRGPRINLRRSIRHSIRTGGDLIELAYRQRKIKRAKLVVICDVSGSMDVYSKLFLQFIYGLQNSFARVESFVFSTSIQRVTDELNKSSYRESLNRLASEVHGWSGGTLISPSIAEFNRRWRAVVDRRTIVVILSDGWDTADPEVLAESLAKLRRSAARLIWLNPLLGNPAFEPSTRGMRAALPHIDVFAPLHDLASIRDLEQYLKL